MSLVCRTMNLWDTFHIIAVFAVEFIVIGVLCEGYIKEINISKHVMNWKGCFFFMQFIIYEGFGFFSTGTSLQVRKKLKTKDWIYPKGKEKCDQTYVKKN